MSNRTLPAAALSVAALLILTGCSASNPANEDTSSPSRPSSLESTSGHSSEPTDEPSTTMPSTTTTATASATAADDDTSDKIMPLALNAEGKLGGDAPVTDFDPGEPGMVSIVDVGTYDAESRSLPFVFRNNTSETITSVAGSTIVNDAEGTAIVTGQFRTTNPAQIPPGGLGLSYSEIEQDDVPADADFEFSFRTSPVGAYEHELQDLSVTDVLGPEGGIVGTAINQTDETLNDYFKVGVYCFAESGTLLSAFQTDANEAADVEPGESLSFSADYDGGECPTSLVGVAASTHSPITYVP